MGQVGRGEHRGVPVWRGGLAALVGACMLLCGMALAAPPAKPSLPPHALAQLGVERWDGASGLRASWVQDVVEAPDGMIWVATANGVSRFDGRAFRHFDAANSPALPHNLITTLALAHDGRIWLGLRYGGVRVIADGTIRRDPAVEGLPDDVRVTALADDGEGGAWVGTPKGLWHATRGTPRRVTVAGESLDVDVRWLVRSGDVVWARTREHGLWSIRGGRVTRHPDPPGCAGSAVDAGPAGLVTSCSDAVWIWQSREGTWRLLSRETGVGPVYLDPDGSVWFGSRKGLARWKDGRLEYRGRDTILPDWRVRAILRDRSGDLWVGTFSAGLARLRVGVVRAVGAREGLDLEGTTAVALAPNGDLLAGGFETGLMQWHPVNGFIGRWTEREGLPGATPWTLSRDVLDASGVWVGGDGGLAWWQDGRLSRVGPRGITHAGPLRLVFADPRDPGVLWAQAEKGPLLALGAPAGVAATANTGLPDGRIRFMHRDRRGRLLAGGEGGLFVRAATGWRAVPAGDVALRELKAIAEGRDGTLWLASEADGLIRMRGREVVVYGVGNGLPEWPAHTLHLDANGRMWLSGNDGITTFRLRDFDRWVAGDARRLPFEHLGQRDGVRDREANGWGYPSILQWRDGSMVYPTISGVAFVDPRMLRTSRLVPSRVYIDQAWAGDRTLDVRRPATLSRDERSLRVRFSVVEMLYPESVDFRYRLDGLDTAWVESGASMEAQYPSLAPGDYRFRVQARLPGQAWTEAGAPLVVSVTPAVVETLWFRVLVGALLVAALVGAWHWRRRADVRLAESLARARAFLRDVIDTSPNPIIVRRAARDPLVMNRAALHVPGLGAAGLPSTGDPVEDAARARLRALEEHVATTGEEGRIDELPLRDADGSERWFRVVMRRGDAPGDQPARTVIITAVDVTGFKRSELALTESRDGLRRSREEARALARQLLSAQEDERRRLAADMHDDVTQRLAGLAMLSWSVLSSLERPAGHEDALRQVRGVATDLELLARQVQSMARELHPPALDALGLADALHAEVASFTERTGLPVTLDVGPGMPDVPTDVALALYRIVQEALRNACTHAAASRASVHVACEPGVLVIEVRDDGQGFDPQARRGRAGIGLSTMRERARLAGAELQITSRPGEGTRVQVRWPSPSTVDAPG